MRNSACGRIVHEGGQVYAVQAIRVVVGATQHVVSWQPAGAHTRFSDCGLCVHEAGHLYELQVASVVVGCKQQWSARHPVVAHKRAWGCQRNFIVAGQWKVPQDNGGVEVVVGCKQQVSFLQPEAAHSMLPACGRFTHAPQLNEAQLGGVVVACRQHVRASQTPP